MPTKLINTFYSLLPSTTKIKFPGSTDMLTQNLQKGVKGVQELEFPSEFELNRDQLLTDYTKLTDLLSLASKKDLISTENNFNGIAQEKTGNVFVIQFNSYGNASDNQSSRIALKYFAFDHNEDYEANSKESEKKNKKTLNFIDKLLFGNYHEQEEARKYLIPLEKSSKNYIPSYFSIDIAFKSGKLNIVHRGIGSLQDIDPQIVEITDSIIDNKYSLNQSGFEFVIPALGKEPQASRYYTKVVFPKVNEVFAIVNYLSKKIIENDNNVRIIAPLPEEEVKKKVQEWFAIDKIKERAKLEETVSKLTSEKYENEENLKNQVEEGNKRIIELTGVSFFKLLTNPVYDVNKWFKNPEIYVDQFKKQIDQVKAAIALLDSENLGIVELEKYINRMETNIKAIEQGLPIFESCKKNYKKLMSSTEDKELDSLKKEFEEIQRWTHRMHIAKKKLEG